MTISQLKGIVSMAYWHKQHADDELHGKTEENELVPSRDGQLQS
jgi:hypothetical protein